METIFVEGLEIGLAHLNESSGNTRSLIWWDVSGNQEPPPLISKHIKFDILRNTQNLTLYYFVDSRESFWARRGPLSAFSGTVVIVFLDPLTIESLQSPVILVSPPKCGTHFLVAILNSLGYKFGGSLPLIPINRHYYAIHQSFHTDPVTLLNEYNIQGGLAGGRLLPLRMALIICLLRNPFDAIESALAYERSASNSVLGYAHFADNQRRVSAYFDTNSVLGNRLDFFNRFVEWIRLPNAFPISYDELVSSDELVAERVVRDLQIALCVSGNAKEFLDANLFSESSPTLNKHRSPRQLNLKFRLKLRKRLRRYLHSAKQKEINSWHESRLRTQIPFDDRPRNTEMTLDFIGFFVLLYLNGRVIARISVSSAEVKNSISKLLGGNEKSFESLEEAEIWVRISNSRIREEINRKSK